MTYSYFKAPRVTPIQSSRLVAITNLEHAIAGQTSNKLASYLHQSLSLSHAAHQPISHYQTDNGTLWSVWHHGDAYKLFAIGPIQLTELCELTDSERESLVLKSRRAKTYDEDTFVVASTTIKTPVSHLPSYGLVCDGLIFCSHAA